MHFSVRTRTQNALFRRVRLSSPAQTSACLTERRILYPPPHGKTHSVSTTSRKSAFCTHRLTEKRTLARRNRRTKACVPVVCLPRSGWSWTGGYADMPTRSWPDGLKPIDPNGTTGPWRPTGYGPTTIMASTPHGRCRIRWRRAGRDPPSQTVAGA